jgi:hypothetical protein
MSLIGANRRGRRTSLAKPLGDECRNRCLIAAQAGDRHQLHDEPQGFVKVRLRHAQRPKSAISPSASAPFGIRGHAIGIPLIS